MKRLRQLCAVTVLTILLANVAAAEGVMHPGYVPPPPPPVTGGTTQPDGTTEEVVVEDNELTTFDLETEITLLLIRNMLALF